MKETFLTCNGVFVFCLLVEMVSTSHTLPSVTVVYLGPRLSVVRLFNLIIFYVLIYKNKHIIVQNIKLIKKIT